MNDPISITLVTIAAGAVGFIAGGFPAVLRYHREWKRRQALTEWQRALEDFGVAVNTLTVTFVTAFTPVVRNLTETFQGLAKALEQHD